MLADTPTYTAAELVTIISVVMGGLVTLVGAVFAGWAAISATRVKHVADVTVDKLAETHAVVQEVAAAVKTMNDLSMGQLADAAESRRIHHVPVDERTDAEREHLAAVPTVEPETVKEVAT